MTESTLQLPPEIWYMISKYVGYYDSLNARMASSQFAAYFGTGNHMYWRVDCCSLAESGLHEYVCESVYYYTTNINNFINGLKQGLVSAQRITFLFCRHSQLPVHRENCSTQKVVEMFGLLKARSITISISLSDHHLPPSICNESLIQAMLFYSIKKLPDATVNFRMKLPYWIDNDSKDNGAYFMAIRDPSMSSAAVKTNLQLALSATTVPQLKRNELWDFAQVHYIRGYEDIHCGTGYFPKLRCLTCPANFDCTNPDELLKKFPKCEWPTARYWSNPDMQPTVEYPESTFYFDYVPEAAARHCTKISAHVEDFIWVLQLIRSNMRLEYVKVLDFHLITGTRGKQLKYMPQMRRLLSIVLSHCSSILPNVETINFLFDPETWNDMARPELLTKGQSLRTEVCQHCQQNVHGIEIGITARRDSLRITGRKTYGLDRLWAYMAYIRSFLKKE